MSGIQITIVKGVVGGFVAPTPTLHIIMETVAGKKKDGEQVAHKALEITHSTLAPEADNAVEGYVTVKRSISLEGDGQKLAMLEGWLATVSTLPTEEPIGCEDVYELDTVIQIVSPTLRWQNTPNQGCNSTPSLKKPSTAQKATFAALANEMIAFTASTLS